MIKRYDPIIYPRKLLVVINPTYKEIKDNFIQEDKYLSEKQFDELSDNSNAVTVNSIFHRRSKCKGHLVIIFDETIGIKTIAHEAYHVVNAMMTELGEEPKGDLEQNAYLLGWVAECIHKTLFLK
jgi:hypothetical protein